MPNYHGYSDRVAHALAFAAKHGAPRVRPGSTGAHLTHPANVAIILARYGCDETCLVAGVLGYLVNEAEASRQGELRRRVAEKFGDKVAEVVDQVFEPRYDARGKQRGWKAWKMDFLANLALAEPRALEVCSATQIHLCGTMLADLRRLGIEYLSQFAPASAEEIVWWYGELTAALARHPVGPRPGMLDELRQLSGRLEIDLATR